MAVTGTTELGNGLLLVTVDADPRVTAVDAPAGSIIVFVGTDAATIRNGDAFRKEDAGSTTNVSELGLKNSFAETTDPGVSNDNTQDYQVGSRWINVTLDKEFVCLNAATGAAVWTQTTSSGATDADAIHDNVAGEISLITEKLVPVAADLVIIEDSAAANAKKRVQVGNLPGGAALPVVDTTSIVEDPVDGTKEMRIDVGLVATATVRVATMPDKDITWDDIADSRTPTAHRSSHISGGGDAFLSTDLLEAITKRLQTTSGPTTLTMGALLDGQGLIRNGTNIVGFNATYVKTTDDLAVLVNAAVAGAEFVLETGSHTLTTGILIDVAKIKISGPRNARIIGAGSLTQLIEVNSSGDDFHLIGCAIEATDTDTHCLRVTGVGIAARCVIERTNFSKFDATPVGDAITFAGDADDWQILHCDFEGTNFDNCIGSSGTTQIRRMKVTGGTMNGSSGNQIRFDGSAGTSQCTFSGITFLAGTADPFFFAAAAEGNTITGCTFENWFGDGVILGGTCNYCTVTGCTFEGGASSTGGVSIQGKGNVVDGNTFLGAATGNAIIATTATCIRPIIANNNIDNWVFGIEVNTTCGDEGKINNNTINACDRGIVFEDGEDWIANDNHILNVNAGVSPVGVGIHLTATTVRRLTLLSNYMEPNKEGILDASDNGFHRFEDNEIIGGTIAISVASGLDGDGIVIKLNKLINQSDSAMIVFFDADGPIVTENIVRGSTKAGAILSFTRNTAGVSKLHVNNNTITNCSSATSCISINDCSLVQANNNKIANNGGDGIFLGDVDNSQINNNQITDQTGDGIEEDSSCSGNDYFNNKFTTITGTNLKLLGTGARTDLSLNPVVFPAGALLPPNNASWKINALAPVITDSNDNSLSVAAFDDTTEEGRGLEHRFDPDAQGFRLKFESRAETGPGAAQTARYKMYFREIPDNAAVTAFSAGTLLAAITIPITTEFFQFDEEEFKLSTLSITAGRRVQFEITRLGTDASDTLSGDLLLKALTLEPF